MSFPILIFIMTLASGCGPKTVVFKSGPAEPAKGPAWRNGRFEFAKPEPDIGATMTFPDASEGSPFPMPKDASFPDSKRIPGTGWSNFR